MNTRFMGESVFYGIFCFMFACIGNSSAQENLNIIFNGDFETTIEQTGKRHPHNFSPEKKIRVPLTKRFPNGTKGPAIYTGKGGEYAYFIDDANARSGKYSLCIKNVNPDKTGKASITWTNVPVETENKYSLAGWVKADKATNIQLYYSLNGKGKNAGFKKFLGEGTFNWKPFLLEIILDAQKIGFEVKNMNIKLINSGTGTVWFDNIYLEKDERK